MVLPILLFVLTVAVCVLGTGTLRRLRKMEGVEDEPRGCSLAILALLALAFLSTFYPFLAVVPATLFLVAGLRILLQGGRLRIDAGVVLLLVSIAWGVFLALEAELLEWEKTVAGAPIRIDIFLTTPAMTVMGAIGWNIARALAGLERGGTPRSVRP